MLDAQRVVALGKEGADLGEQGLAFRVVVRRGKVDRGGGGCLVVVREGVMVRTELGAGEREGFVAHDLAQEGFKLRSLPGAQATAVVLEQLHEDALGDVVGVVVVEAGVAAGGVVDEAGVAADEVVDGGRVAR